jgi:hypothetical protein
MRVLIFWRLICLAALLLSCPAGLAQEKPLGAGKPAPLTPAQRQRLKERDRLNAEAPRLWDAGKKAEALAVWQKKLAIEREVFGQVHEVVAQSLERLARMHEWREDFRAARQARQEVLAIRTQLYGEQDWRVTDARLDLKYLKALTALDAEGRRQLQRATALYQRAGRLW